MSTFTEADRKKLEALKEKERQAKQDARNEQKRADNLCKKLFGRTVKEVKDALENPPKAPEAHDYFNEYYDLKKLVTRLMKVMGKEYDEFEGYVEWREQKKAEQVN